MMVTFAHPDAVQASCRQKFTPVVAFEAATTRAPAVAEASPCTA